MNSTIENSISSIAARARGRYQAILTDARSRTERAAGRVAKGKMPVKTFSRLGLKLTATSHRTADKVLKQQTKMVEHQIDAFAGRLAAAAEANSVRDLLMTQFRLIPENAALLANDTRAALGIFVGAGAEVRSLIKDTADELRGRKPAAAKATAKAPAAPRKKAAKRKPAKKAPVAHKAVVESEVEAPKAA